MSVEERLTRWLEGLVQWSERVKAAEAARPFLPKCPFCRDRKRLYKMNRPTLVPNRFSSPKVRMVVICLGCGMRMTASRYYYSNRWSFTDGD